VATRTLSKRTLFALGFVAAVRRMVIGAGHRDRRAVEPIASSLAIALDFRSAATPEDAGVSGRPVPRRAQDRPRQKIGLDAWPVTS
jgi:hypothetical protein